MCVICIKPVGVKLPPAWTFEQSFKKNPHGAGFAIADPDHAQVIIRKGFRSADDVRKCLNNTIEEMGRTPRGVLAVVHFRFATHGSHSDGNCHPFPVVSDIADLKKSSNECKTAVFHNGIFRNVNIPAEGDLSDTMAFVKDCLAGHSFGEFLKYKSDLVEFVTAGYRNKLVILHHDQRFIKIGEFFLFRGCLWSNKSYQMPEYMRRQRAIGQERTDHVTFHATQCC